MILNPNNVDNWQTKRNKRIKDLADYLKKVKIIEKEVLLGKLGIDGVRRPTAESYLQDLKDSKKIKEENGKIIWISKEDL